MKFIIDINLKEGDKPDAATMAAIVRQFNLIIERDIAAGLFRTEALPYTEETDNKVDVTSIKIWSTIIT